MQTAPLPPPYKGENNQLPQIAVQSPFCEKMYNFNNIDGSLNLRQGHSIFAAKNQVGIAPLNISSYDASTPLLFAMVGYGGDLYWYDITAGAFGAAAHTLAAAGDDEIHTLYFNGYLFYFGESALTPASTGPQVYNGTVWGTSGLTWPASFVPFGGNVHKNRAYFIDRLTGDYGYSELDSPNSGTVTRVSLSSLVFNKTVLFGIRSISMSENVTQENVQSFIMGNGEIFVYSGSYPGSVATWQLISRFRVSKVLYQNAIVDAKGDSFLLTETEILSLRNLFVSGYDAEKAEGIGAPFKNRWRQIVRGLLNSADSYRYLIKGVYDEAKDRLIISLPRYVDPDTGTVSGTKVFQVLYDFTLGAWYEYIQNDGSVAYTASACYFSGSPYVFSSSTSYASVFKLEGKTNFLDDQTAGGSPTGIIYQMRTAPLPISKYGANSIEGVEILSTSDLYPQTNYKFVADLGRQTTGAQPLVAQGTTIAKPMANVGVQSATTVQLDVSGTSVSATTGLKIFGFNVWYNTGPEGAR